MRAGTQGAQGAPRSGDPELLLLMRLISTVPRRLAVTGLNCLRAISHIETVGDDADLQEAYDTERHLLYVACTRARDHLWLQASSQCPSFWMTS